jgi:hypothetical protein
LIIKYWLAIFLIFSLQLYGASQHVNSSLEVLLIGAAHEYSPKTPQDLRNVHAKIRAFKPDAFFGEWLSAEDEKSLKSYGHKGWVMRRYELLKSKNNIPEELLDAEICRLESLSAKDPKNMICHIDLAIALYLNSDQGNGYFHMWKVAKYLEKNPTDTLVFNYAKRKFYSDVVDTVEKAVRPYTHDEYDYIAHPMMEEMNMAKIFPMDSQRWDGQGSGTWRQPDSILNAYIELYKRDTITPIGNKVNAVHNTFKARLKYLEDIAKMKYGEDHFTEALNGPELTERLHLLSMIPEDFKQFDFFPVDLYHRKYLSWRNRNYDMCLNTIDRAAANNFRKVVIVVGANHAKIMRDLFIDMGVKVININD